MFPDSLFLIFLGIALPSLLYSKPNNKSLPKPPANEALDIPISCMSLKSLAIPKASLILSVLSLASNKISLSLLLVANVNFSSGLTFLNILSDNEPNAFCFITIPATSAL